MGAQPKTNVDDKGRVCTKCKKYKFWSAFNKATKGCRGYRSRCQGCDREASEQWKKDTDYYQVNRDQILNYKRSSGPLS